MTIESSVAALTDSTTALISAVGVQQIGVGNSITAFNAVTTRVNAGLNNVDNTHDTDKPISILTQSALDQKQAFLVSGQNISTINGQSLLSGLPLVIARSATSLNYIAYDDRGNLRTTISQVDDSTMVEGLGLFRWVGSQDEPEDDETCFNTATGQWLLQVPAWDLVSAWNSYEESYAADWKEDELARFAAYTLNNK